MNIVLNKTASRLVAIQTIYNLELIETEPEHCDEILKQVVSLYKENIISACIDQEIIVKPNITFASKLVKHFLSIKDKVVPFILLLTQECSYVLPTEITDVLKISITELIHYNTHPVIITSEYTNIASCLTFASKAKVVNAILDKLNKNPNIIKQYLNLT